MSRSARPRFGLRFRRPGPCDWRCGRPTADAPRRACAPVVKAGKGRDLSQRILTVAHAPERRLPRVSVPHPVGVATDSGRRPWAGTGSGVCPDGLCCLVALRGGVRGRSCFFQSRSARRGVCGRPHGRRRGRGRPSLLSAGRPRGSSGLKPVVTLAGREPRSQSPRHISSSAWGRGGGWNLGGHFPSRNRSSDELTSDLFFRHFSLAFFSDDVFHAFPSRYVISISACGFLCVGS